MKILFLTDGITPYVNGGMQRHSQLVIEYLGSNGHQITVYHYVSSDQIVDESIEPFSSKASDNIRLVRFKYTDTGILPGHYIRAQKDISNDYLSHLISDSHDFDFIYTKGFMGWALLRKREEYGIKAPIAVKFHGMNMFQKQPNFKGHLSKYLLRPTTRWILKKSDYVFSYGGKITDIIRSQCSTPILEVPTGIESSWLKDHPNSINVPRRFLFVGRYDRVKGLPELYEALKILNSIRSDWEFHFIGPIPVQHQLSMKHVKYHGAIYDSNGLKSKITSNDILVNCSISEGMPNVILEAMSQGLGVIATDVGATSVLVNHGQNGHLLMDSKPRSIVTALNEALSISENELISWKERSLRKANELTWDSIGPTLEASIQKCVEA